MKSSIHSAAILSWGLMLVASPTVQSLIVVPSTTTTSSFTRTTAGTGSTTRLYMGIFDNKFRAGGTGRDSLDEEWEKQQAILKQRRAPKSERDAYFTKIETRREEASKKQAEMWGWQSKQYTKGEDPINEWKKRRASGSISDLEDQYGDPRKIGGIPFPMPSFGVGGGKWILYPGCMIDCICFSYFVAVFPTISNFLSSSLSLFLSLSAVFRLLSFKPTYPHLFFDMYYSCRCYQNIPFGI
jgi:hypothetical protein